MAGIIFGTRPVSGESLWPQLQAQATADAVGDHPERKLLACVSGKFKEIALLGIKGVKRQMDGRTKLDVLRVRVLHPN